MFESILTISVAGIFAGFILSMPIAGPVSILITSNALKGRLRYCNLASLGASIADFIYVFVAVFGLTKLYSLYKPVIPYILVVGAIFFLYLGIKIIKTNIDIEHLEDKSNLSEKIKEKDRGALYSGFMINFLNPTLFIGVLTSSFFVISLLAALGFHTGGLATEMDKNVKEITMIEGIKIDSSQSFNFKKIENLQIPKLKNHPEEPAKFPHYFHLLISICYAFFLALGSLLWFFLMAFLVVRFRHRINVKIISFFIKSLGFFLCLFGVYFGYLSVLMLLKMT
jgi:threonine/homoserine/homoserine lactone efflux protein